MSSKLDSPVQTQRAVAAFDAMRNGECHGSVRVNSDRIRRAILQPDIGCVNAHVVGKGLQLVPGLSGGEGSSTFSNFMLKNENGAVVRYRSDSPARNGMYRSSSTPYVSPTRENLQQNDQCGPVEIIGGLHCCSNTRELVESVACAIQKGVDPIPVHGGLGGAYYFRNSNGENAAVVKPIDEEPFAPNNPKGFAGRALGQPGFKHSVRVGETGLREVAAYLLDYNHFSSVPPTVLVKIEHSIFNVNDDLIGNKLQKRKKISKIASLQQYVPHDFDAGDYGTSSFPVAAVHRIGILDIRIFNTDRHAGNILVRKLDRFGRFGQVELIPIDHGLCLPESLEDPYFEWIHWPQASIPFSEDELEYIKNLDPFQDFEMLKKKLPMIREACLRVLVLCTIFLQQAAAFGLCLTEIGEMMSREFCGQEEQQPSELELICLDARSMTDRKTVFFGAEEEDKEFLFDMDCQDSEASLASKFSRSSINGRLPMPKLDESFEDDEVEVTDEPGSETIIERPIFCSSPPLSRLSTSPKNVNLAQRSQFCNGGKAKGSYMVGSLFMNRRSANEQLTSSVSFVKLADMNEEEWGLFLERFMELLYPAFVERRSLTMQRQKQRLGTSCQF